VDRIDMTAHLTRIECEGSNEVDGTDDGLLWNDSKEDGNVRVECKKDEGTYFEDGDSDTHW
jgi:hypothetical protein